MLYHSGQLPPPGWFLSRLSQARAHCARPAKPWRGSDPRKELRGWDPDGWSVRSPFLQGAWELVGWVPHLGAPFTVSFLGEGSGPYKNRLQEKGTRILTSLPEDLVGKPSGMPFLGFPPIE